MELKQSVPKIDLSTGKDRIFVGLHFFRQQGCQLAFRNRDLDLRIGDVLLDIDTAVPCGLIINELVSNALQHAFAESDPAAPLIAIEFSREPSSGACILKVSDNGPGLPPEIDVQATPSMGLEIVRILTQQLKGTLALESAPGACFRIEFSC